MSETKIAVIIDPYSSGALYASEFAKHGVSCIAVQSSLPLPSHFLHDFDPSDFIKVLPPAPGHVLASQLSGQNIVTVAAGCDTAITLADELSNALRLAGNDPATSAMRRYKDQMHEALKLCGLRYMETKVFGSLENFTPRLNEFDNAATFVIKPINSAGSEGVRFAKGRRGVAEAMTASGWEQKNVLGEINSGFVVQPFTHGCEYVVDMVPTGKEFFIAAVCRVHKVNMNGSMFVCDSVDMLDPRDAELGPLTEYAQEAAHGLGVLAGPVHMELIWGIGGPVMIEANCRLPGAGLPSIYSQVYNPDLLSATVCTYLDKPITYNGSSIPAHSSKRDRFGRIICLVSEVEHEFTGVAPGDLQKLSTLKSYRGHKLNVKKHATLVRTIDFATCPGVVFLANESLRRVDDDEKRARDIFSRYLTMA